MNYLKEVFSLSQNYNHSQIFNFDESSFYMDYVGNYTFEKRGSKRAFCKTSGKEKVRLSCLMTASADGFKLPVLCVIPRKKQIPNLNIGENFIFIFETKGFTLKIIKLNNHNSILFLKRYFQYTKPC